MKNIDVQKREKFRVPRLQICYEFRPNPHPYNCGYRNWSPFFLNGADSRSIFIVCFFKYGEGRPRHINQNILENINKLDKKIPISYKWKQCKNHMYTMTLHCRKIYTEKHIWVQSYLPSGKEMGSFRQTIHSVVKSEILFGMWKVLVLQNQQILNHFSLHLEGGRFVLKNIDFSLWGKLWSFTKLLGFSKFSQLWTRHFLSFRDRVNHFRRDDINSSSILFRMLTRVPPTKLVSLHYSTELEKTMVDTERNVRFWRECVYV